METLPEHPLNSGLALGDRNERSVQWLSEAALSREVSANAVRDL